MAPVWDHNICDVLGLQIVYIRSHGSLVGLLIEGLSFGWILRRICSAKNSRVLICLTPIMRRLCITYTTILRWFIKVWCVRPISQSMCRCGMKTNRWSPCRWIICTLVRTLRLFSSGHSRGKLENLIKQYIWWILEWCERVRSNIICRQCILIYLMLMLPFSSIM